MLKRLCHMLIVLTGVIIILITAPTSLAQELMSETNSVGKL
jgi:hypothetical protein